MKNILKQVKSPFTDEMIKNLFKEYIYGNVNLDEFYRVVNAVEISDLQDNQYVTQVSREIESNFAIVSNSNYPYWNIVKSDENYLDIPNNREDRTEIYRFYLNVKGQDKAVVIRRYIEECQKRNQGFKFKYSFKDGRNDEIVILTNAENFVDNVDIIKQITKDITLGELPKLVGKYENNIGIAEEYINAPIYSYTKVRLAILPIVIQKYILDHIDEFPLNVQQIFGLMKKRFGKRLAIQIKMQENEPEKFALENKWNDEKTAFENNIEIMFTMVSEKVEPLFKSIKEIIDKKGIENVLSELVDGYRLACKVSGISEAGVFSLETERNMELYSKEDVSVLAQELQDLQQQITENTKIRDSAKCLLKAYEEQEKLKNSEDSGKSMAD